MKKVLPLAMVVIAMATTSMAQSSTKEIKLKATVPQKLAVKFKDEGKRIELKQKPAGFLTNSTATITTTNEQACTLELSTSQLTAPGNANVDLHAAFSDNEYTGAPLTIKNKDVLANEKSKEYPVQIYVAEEDTRLMESGVEYEGVVTVVAQTKR